MTPSADVEVVLAGPYQRAILANLLELYLHDFSEFHDVALGADGKFGYKSLPLYWSESGRHPFLLKVDGGWAGFAFVKTVPGVLGDERVWDMAEFFIVRGLRRRGIGTEIAHQVWRQFPGLWQVRVMESNAPVLGFWINAITTFMGKPIRSARVQVDGQVWHVFSFESKPGLHEVPPRAGQDFKEVG